MPRVKYMRVSIGDTLLRDYPSFSASGNIAGMKKLYYGENALLVRSGSYIYNVTSNPSLYELAD